MTIPRQMLRQLRRYSHHIHYTPSFSNSQYHLHTVSSLLSVSPVVRSPSSPSFILLPRLFSSSPDESDLFVLPHHSDTATAADESVSLWKNGLGDGLVGETMEEPLLPVRAVITLLEGFHDSTGLPWWIVIASSTFAIRITLLPLLVLQLRKLKRIAELFPKLPPPFPPPLSGKSLIDQFSFFNQKRRALGCPTYLWFLATFSVQVPCFLLFMITIRTMSLGGHPGFNCGGTLWFQDLTAVPHGAFSPVFPVLIASMHYINIQISFKANKVKRESGLFGLFAKWYKRYLDFLTVPLFFVSLYLPQGSLIYWVTNSSLNLIVQSSLKNPVVLAKLGLLAKDTSSGVENSSNMGMTGLESSCPNSQSQMLSPHKLTPKELIALSVQCLSKGHQDRAITLLRVALDKDPGYVRGLLLMGQTLLQKNLLNEAIKYLERSVSMLLDGRPLDVEEIDLLILASQWAGVAYVRQEKMAEGIVHLERIASFKEPEDPKSKAHYFDGLLLLSSALHKEGRKDVAEKYLRLVVAYNPSYSYLLEECVSNDDFVDDLTRSRRGNCE